MSARWHNDYTVGWICALPLEMAAARAMLDEAHIRLQQPEDGHNTYVLGEISGHNVVVACLPSGIYGTISAAVVAKQMLFTFRSIRFGLMVGIGGGVSSPSTEIRLGDVVVSKPTGVSAIRLWQDLGFGASGTHRNAEPATSGSAYCALKSGIQPLGREVQVSGLSF